MNGKIASLSDVMEKSFRKVCSSTLRKNDILAFSIASSNSLLGSIIFTVEDIAEVLFTMILVFTSTEANGE